MGDERIQKIEESQAFVERTLEELHAEVLSAYRAMESISKRIERIEAQLRKADAADTESESDPEPT